MNPIVEKKRSKDAEFFINLFEWCNLRCTFCWQDHTKWDGIESIAERADDVIDCVIKDHRKHYVINLMGGELFADQISDQTFADYETLCLRIKNEWPHPLKTFEVNWVTNLIFEKTDRVVALVERLRGHGITNKLTTSFDFSGRFNAYNKLIFERNVYALQPLIGTVSVVLTRPNIQSYMTKVDTVFERMYRDGFYFYFDYYSPEKNYQRMAPSDEVLQLGLKYLVDHYPDVWPVAGWLRDDIADMSCRGSMIIDHTGFKGQCRSLLTDSTAKLLNSKVDLSSNETMETAFVNKYNCIECEYYLKCGMGCFLQHDFKGREELSECLYKGVFKHIDR